MLSMMRHSSPSGKIPAEARFCFINAAGLDFWGSFAKFVSHTHNILIPLCRNVSLT